MFARPCFEAWLGTRRGELKDPEEAFRRAITMHATGTKGRQPFPADVEMAVLKEMRKKRVWPCFEGRFTAEGLPITFGLYAFRSVGFHEQRAEQGSNDSPDEHLPRPTVAPLKNESLSDGAPKQAASSCRRSALSASSHSDEAPNSGSVQDAAAFEFFNSMSDHIPFAHDSPWVAALEQGLRSPMLQSFPEDLEQFEAAATLAAARGLKRRAPDTPGPQPNFTWEPQPIVPAPAMPPSPTLTSAFDAENFLRATAEADPQRAAYMNMNRAAWEADPDMLQYLLRVMSAQRAELAQIADADSATDRLPGFSSPSLSVRASVIKTLYHVTHPDRMRAILNADASARTLHAPGDLQYGLEALMARMRVTDPRFCRTFRFPAAAADPDTAFDMTREIGRSVMDAYRLQYVQCSEGAARIVGRSLKGLLTTSTNVSPAAYWLLLRDVAAIIMLRGDVTFQSMVRRPTDGHVYVARMRYVLLDGGRFIQSTFQDVSHLYPHLLALPPPAF